MGLLSHKLWVCEVPLGLKTGDQQWDMGLW